MTISSKTWAKYQALPLEDRVKLLRDMLEDGEDVDLDTLQTPKEWWICLADMSLFRLKRIAARLRPGDHDTIREFDHDDKRDLIQYMIDAKFPEGPNGKTA